MCQDLGSVILSTRRHVGSRRGSQEGGGVDTGAEGEHRGRVTARKVGGYNVCTALRVESSLNGCRHGGLRRRVRARRLRCKLSDVECQVNTSN